MQWTANRKKRLKEDDTHKSLQHEEQMNNKNSTALVADRKVPPTKTTAKDENGDTTCKDKK
eukprot:14266157-Ditylum_brightwellii.AAC.1